MHPAYTLLCNDGGGCAARFRGDGIAAPGLLPVSLNTTNKKPARGGYFYWWSLGESNP